MLYGGGGGGVPGAWLGLSPARLHEGEGDPSQLRSPTRSTGTRKRTDTWAGKPQLAGPEGSMGLCPQRAAGTPGCGVQRD